MPTSSSGPRSSGPLSSGPLSFGPLSSGPFSSTALVSPDSSTQPSAQQPSMQQLSGSDNTRCSPLRLGIMASGSGSNFEAIAQAIERKDLNARIEIVIYNNPGARVVERARRLGIPAQLINHREFESRESLDLAIVAALRSYGVTWVIMAGWMRRVTQQLISAFPQRILNIHPSLLPSFPGINAVKQALNAQVKITGCSVHYVELVVDSGPIIMQAAVPVLPNDTEKTLQARIQVQEHRIFPQAIKIAAQHEAYASNIETNP